MAIKRCHTSFRKHIIPLKVESTCGVPTGQKHDGRVNLTALQGDYRCIAFQGLEPSNPCHVLPIFKDRSE